MVDGLYYRILMITEIISTPINLDLETLLLAFLGCLGIH